jgi:hypothetical protein
MGTEQHGGSVLSLLTAEIAENCRRDRGEDTWDRVVDTRVSRFPKEVSNANVTQPKTSPQETSEHEGKNHVEPTRANANLTRDGATEVSGQQDCSEDSGARKQIQQGTCQQNHADTYNFGFRISQP